MGTSTSLAQAAAKVANVLDASTVEAMARAGGMAGKKSAREAAANSLGGDRGFSGFKRVRTLDAGFDVAGSQATIKYRPPGGWILAESGRKRTKQVRGKVFRTPYGPRYGFESRPSRGLNTLSNAKRDAAREVPKAAHKALRAELGRVF